MKNEKEKFHRSAHIPRNSRRHPDARALRGVRNRFVRARRPAESEDSHEEVPAFVSRGRIHLSEAAAAGEDP